MDAKNHIGVSKENLELVSSEYAINKILNGEPLNNMEIEEIVYASNVSIPKITMQNCKIGKLQLEGCVCVGNIVIENCTIGEAVLSNNDHKELIRKTIFKQNIRIQKTIFENKFTCVQGQFEGEYTCNALFREECFIQHSEFYKDVSLNESVYEKKLRILSCTFRGNLWMRRIKVKKILSLSKLECELKINLGHSLLNDVTINMCVFKQRVGCNAIEVAQKIEFLTCSFHGEFSSQGAIYHDNFAMHRSFIGGVVSLANTIFHKKKTINYCHIKNKINTKETVYNGVFSLNNVNCEASLNFSDIIFRKDFLCRNSYFGGEDAQLNFENARFENKVDFENTQVNIPFINFKSAKFNKVSFTMTKWGTPSGLVEFSNCHFYNQFNAKNATFQGRTTFAGSSFDGKVKYDNSIFLENAFLQSCIYKEYCSFEGCQFLKQSHFTECQFEDVNFVNSEFEGIARFSTEASILDCPENQNASVFNGNANFANARFNKKALFQKVQFHKQALFGNAYFGEQISFREALFKEDAAFRGTFCSLELDLRQIKVEKELTLKGANISRRLNLADASFSKISFYNMVTDVIAITPESINGKLRGDNNTKNPIDVNRSAQEYLALKKSFAMQGMHEEEDWAYSNFRRCQRRYISLQAKKDRKIWPLIKSSFEKIFIDYGSNYGTNPFRITFLAAALILSFGAFYWMFPTELILEGDEITKGQTPNFGQCVYFSVMAFTTMGFGDVHPNFYGWLKGIVAFEALVGIITMTLFVGTYARKIVR